MLLVRGKGHWRETHVFMAMLLDALPCHGPTIDWYRVCRKGERNEEMKDSWPWKQSDPIQRDLISLFVLTCEHKLCCSLKVDLGLQPDRYCV